MEQTGKTDDEAVLISRQKALRLAQELLAQHKKPGDSWADELSEDRRKEAERETEE